MPPSRTCDCGECRTCYQREYMRERRKRVKPTEEERQRARERARSAYWRDVEHSREQVREYQQNHRAEADERVRQWRLRHPEKARAHQQTAYALRIGRLVREPCEACGAEGAEAHHDDYSKPLDVRWLCKTHHVEHHMDARQAA